MQKKYEKELDLRKEEGNTGELKKVLQEKSKQMQILSENNNKLKAELEFYRNRNKELEGVVSRTEKKFKEDMQTMER